MVKSEAVKLSIKAAIDKEQRHVRISPEGDSVYYCFSLASAVDCADRDEECEISRIRITGEGGDWRAVVSWKSNIWEGKRHYYEYADGVLTQWVEVSGKGRIDILTFGGGTVGGVEEASVPGFGTVFTGTPNFLDKPWSHPSEFTGISAGNITELWGSALNGGPLMFAFGEACEDGWIGAGILARPGEYGFHTLSFGRKRKRARETHDNIIGTQSISLDYLGNEEVDGKWTSPKLMMFAGRNASECLKEYCEKVYAGGYAPKPLSKPRDWWSKPIFCTWHEQVGLANSYNRGVSSKETLEGGATNFGMLNEANVRKWLKRFEKHGIRFGTIILDAMWQKDCGGNVADPEKFPDMRKFIDELHGRGYRVLLWIKSWEMDGIPADWCVKRDGEPVMADPTHPGYREFVAKMMGMMLGDGEGEYNADGLKVDGTGGLPDGYGLRSHGKLYGFELLHAYMKLVFDSAKAVKPEAIVSHYGANPIMADSCDMVRLGDLYTFRGDPIHTMRWRAETYRAGLPHALIDTDGTLRFSMRDGDAPELFAEQRKIGIPCVYEAETLYKNRAFTPTRIRKLTAADYALLKEHISPDS